MEVGQQINFITIHKKASSLYTLVADGVSRYTSVSRDTWKTLLISQGSLQRNCNQEGFNALSGVGSNWNMDWSKVRIGILANSNNDCITCDSRIGFGGRGMHDDTNTRENDASFGSDNGERPIKAMDYILVQ